MQFLHIGRHRMTVAVLEPAAPLMTRKSARRITARIQKTAHAARQSVAKLQCLVEEAKAGSADVVLGYNTWRDYLAAVLGVEPMHLPREERQEMVGYLRGEQLTTRAIAAIVGVSHMQVQRDSGVTNVPPDGATVVGLDGKEYPATKAKATVPTDMAASGLYSTIVADPPWRYSNTSTRGAAEDHYDTMTIDELCDLDVARERSAPQSHLYLWSTAGHLPDAFKVMQAWGFEYKTYLVWVKPQMGMGNYFRISTELVLFGIKGGMRTNDMATLNWFEAKRGRHSAKPEVFYDLVAKSSPPSYLEMFSRCNRESVLDGTCRCSRCRLGWHVYGDESSA